MTVIEEPVVHSGQLDHEARIVEASPGLLALHRRYGGGVHDPLALPGLPLLVRRAAALDMPLSSSLLVAEPDGNVTYWVRAVPEQQSVRLQLFDWNGNAAAAPQSLSCAARERDFMRASGDWLWQCDARLCWTHLSESASAVFGRPAMLLIGSPISDALQTVDGTDLGSGHDPATWFDDRVVMTPGAKARRYFRLHGAPDPGAEGFSGSAVEISEAEALALAARSLATKAEPEPSLAGAPAAAANMPTDILRAPLESITRSAEAMKAQSFGHLKHVYTGYAGDIASAARHLRTLIDDVFDVAAIDSATVSLAIEKVDLTELAEEARAIVSQRATEAHTVILWRLPPQSTIVRADRGRALQILINLLQNAVKFAGAAGPVQLSLEASGDEALLRVDDAGRGIPEGDRARIFEKFERLQSGEVEGSGLGLYISRSLARAMGGDIIAGQSPEGGARFTLVLARA